VRLRNLAQTESTSFENGAVYLKYQTKLLSNNDGTLSFTNLSQLESHNSDFHQGEGSHRKMDGKCVESSLTQPECTYIWHAGALGAS